MPIKIFNEWLINWEKAIKEKKIDCLILNYNDFKINEKNYIDKILNFLEIEDCKSSDILKKHKKRIEKMKNKTLEDNLKKNLHSQTYNRLSDNIKFKLNKEISDEEINNLIKNTNYRACSSVVERFVDIEEAISSILITPTKTKLAFLALI